MSEQSITGVCVEIAQKPGNDWVEFHIDGGGQYPVRLSTKLQPLIEMGKVVGGNLATWTYKEAETDKINPKSGKPFVNRYLERVEVGGTENPPSSVATPVPAPKPATSQPSSDGMSKDEWGRKDSAIHMMAAIKAAGDALKHTVPSDPTPEDLSKFIERVKVVSYNWWQRADAVRKGDESDVPFLSEHDEQIPY